MLKQAGLILSAIFNFHRLGVDGPDPAGRHTGHDGIILRILGYYRPGAYHTVFSHSYARGNANSCPQPCVFPNYDGTGFGKIMVVPG